MTILTFSVYSKRGGILFTKLYNNKSNIEKPDEEVHKLVFGMVFSVKEMANTLMPQTAHDRSEKISVVKTARAHLHMLETGSGLRFCIYTTASSNIVDLQPALSYIYSIWVDTVVRSPLYDPEGEVKVGGTNFER